jgi:hypothetical protein
LFAFGALSYSLSTNEVEMTNSVYSKFAYVLDDYGHTNQQILYYRNPDEEPYIIVKVLTYSNTIISGVLNDAYIYKEDKDYSEYFQKHGRYYAKEINLFNPNGTLKRTDRIFPVSYTHQNNVKYETIIYDSYGRVAKHVYRNEYMQQIQVYE